MRSNHLHRVMHSNHLRSVMYSTTVYSTTTVIEQPVSVKVSYAGDHTFKVDVEAGDCDLGGARLDGQDMVDLVCTALQSTVSVCQYVFLE